MTSYPPPPQGPPYPQQTPPPGQPVPQAGPLYGTAGSPLPPPPPPPPGSVPVAKAPPAAWLIPAAALLAVIGAFTPWFTPHGAVAGYSQDFSSLYSFKDGKVGLIAPIALLALAITVVGLLRGKVRGRLASSADPVRTAGKSAIAVGLVSVVCLVIAWFLVTTQYKFTANGIEYSWGDFESKIKAAGGSLSRGPQIGYWLTLAGAILALIAGVVMLVQAKTAPAVQRPTLPPPGGFPPPAGNQPGAFPPPAGYPATGPSLDKQPPPSA